MKTLLAAYDATQHLIAWRHEAPAAWKLPAEAMPVIAEPRCRREADGRVIDSSAWQQGLQALVSRPTSGPAATNWKAYLDKLPTDPWGKPYQYRSPGEKNEFDIFSFGKDGQAGGEGENADIGNWN